MLEGTVREDRPEPVNAVGHGVRTFLLIQALRGVAALMVVWHHITLMQNERLTRAREVWLPGAAGVDLFFVISGFVMVLSSRSLRDSARPARIFLKRRVERVVPMYWLVTTVKLGLALLVPAWAAHGVGGAWHVVSSYLFLPSRNAVGAVHPVLIVGWTLNYEAAFYVLVAVGLALRLALVPYLSMMLAALAGLGWLLRGGLPVALRQMDPLLLEFMYGVLLAWVLPRLRMRRSWEAVACWAAMLAGFAAMQMTPAEVMRESRPFVWGVAAAIVVGSAIALEDVAGRWVPRWLLKIGDASYANYLVHTLVLAAAGSMLVRYRWLGRVGWLPETVVCFVSCIVVAQIVYRVVELPMLEFFKVRRG